MYLTTYYDLVDSYLTLRGQYTNEDEEDRLYMDLFTVNEMLQIK
jgi:hypothetical protein